MDLSPFNASSSIVIAAPPEVLYDFIADMPAMGELSRQCTGGEWQGDERGVGARFVGSNTVRGRTWQATMQVIVADRPREFAWENIGGVNWADQRPVIRWGYTFEPVDEGTRVEETWRIIDTYDGLEAQSEEFLQNLPAWTKRNMDTTLSNMKARFEAAHLPTV